MMTSEEIRQKFLDFFEKQGHKIVPSSSLVPENDSSVLFTTAGMQQFKSFYIKQEWAPAKNVASVQKCVRTSDIDEVGDESHLTFFEMLGNFSFGGYFKEEAIKYAHQFITRELNLKIDYVSIFAGEGKVPRDSQSEKIWKAIDKTLKIVEAGRQDNFWGPTGEEGPCGPTTEIYINGVEIWNIVFNEYYQKKDGSLEPLEVKGVDTGMGLERLVVQIQGKENVYQTDLFNGEKTRQERIVTDHVKAALFMISDGVRPSNTGAGYVLRRLIRRAVRFSKEPLEKIVEKVRQAYASVYALDDDGEIQREEKKFRQTLEKGMREFEKGTDAFTLFSSYGFPFELTSELAAEKGLEVDEEGFREKFKKHQEISKAGMDKQFKGGLAGHSDIEVRYHTATHLLHQALRDVLGPEVGQKGSNITTERTRFDFMFPRKLTDEEKQRVEDIVNKKIRDALPVHKIILPKEEAEKTGALHFFNQKYPDEVSVYYIGQSLDTAWSKEFCGGPHVSNTQEIGQFKITKEEAVAQGIRRIKAVLE